jgi:hypothetical protein
VADHLDYWYFELARKMKILPFLLLTIKEYRKEAKYSLQIIKDEEISMLENPLIDLEEKRITKMLNCLNDAKFKLLMDSINLKFISAEPFRENMGMVNSMFIINAQTVNGIEVELMLRLTEQHPFFTNKKTANEVAVINYLKQNTKIPVPIVLSHSNSKETSLIGCEYILMNKVKGKLLGDLIDEKFQDVNCLPEKLIDQMLEVFKQLRSVKFSQNKIGSFDLNMNIVALAQFGPFIEPCDNYLQFINKQLEWSIKEMNKIKIYKKLANELEMFRKNLNQIVLDKKCLDNLNFNDEMSLTHGDLHAGNVFVDPDTYEITAIIDWEWAHFGW